MFSDVDADRDTAVVVVQRVDAMGSAATRILARRQRWEVPIKAVFLTGGSHQSTATDGAGHRATRITRGQKSGDGRIAHASSVDLMSLEVSDGGVSLR